MALALDGNLKHQLAVHLEGLVRHCSRPLHLWMLVRDHDESDYARLNALFPTVTFTWLPCDKIEHGVLGGVPAHITPSTFDRLLLPELLPELDRIVYLDIDTLPATFRVQFATWNDSPAVMLFTEKVWPMSLILTIWSAPARSGMMTSSPACGTPTGNQFAAVFQLWIPPAVGWNVTVAGTVRSSNCSSCRRGFRRRMVAIRWCQRRSRSSSPCIRGHVRRWRLWAWVSSRIACG